MVTSRPSFRSLHTRRASGFTLIELLVTMTMLAVVLSLAVPALRQFVVRNQMSSIANEFAASVVQARAEAVTRNTCVSLCQSDDTASALAGGAVTCSTTGTNDWLKGTIIFENRACDLAPTTTGGTNTALIRIIQPPGDSYQLIANNGTPPRVITFDARGLPGATAVIDMKLTGDAGNSVIQANQRQICISRAGSVNIRKLEASAC